ncbi:hypothetical protein BDZ89DRAFT_956497, partial [Hymenopellis radicata]
PPRLPSGIKKPRKPKKGCEIAPSPFRPHVLAPDRLFCWTSPFSIAFDETLFNVIPRTAPTVLKLARNALEESTRGNYGAGLLRFHQYCDDSEIPESMRMPASMLLLAGFVGWAVERNTPGNTIGKWMSGLHGWHTLNRAEWFGGDEFISLLKFSANKMNPPNRRPVRNPVSLEHLAALEAGLNMSNCFDAAVYAVAVCAFWGCCRLGELTVRSRSTFEARRHVTRGDSIRFRTTPDGTESAHLHIPWGKVEREQGADLTFTSPCGEFCPVQALRRHFTLNDDIPASMHFFSFRTADGLFAPMVKDWFLLRCREIWTPLELDFVHGHSFRPGGATELLMAGVAPETVAKVGRWSSLAFLIYWRKLESLLPVMITRSYSTARISEVKSSLEVFRIKHNIPEKICIP